MSRVSRVTQAVAIQSRCACSVHLLGDSMVGGVCQAYSSRCGVTPVQCNALLHHLRSPKRAVNQDTDAQRLSGTSCVAVSELALYSGALF